MKKKMNESKDIEYYLNLPYKYIFIPEESGGYSVKIKEFPGCTAFGETIEVAFKNIKESMKIWLSEVIKQKLEIPLPESNKEYSGKFLIRVPKSVHKKLVEDAEKDGVSMNQYILTLLSKKAPTFETYVQKKAPAYKKAYKDAKIIAKKGTITKVAKDIHHKDNKSLKTKKRKE